MAILHMGKGGDLIYFFILKFLSVVVNLTVRYTEVSRTVEFPTNPHSKLGFDLMGWPLLLGT